MTLTGFHCISLPISFLNCDLVNWFWSIQTSFSINFAQSSFDMKQPCITATYIQLLLKDQIKDKMIITASFFIQLFHFLNVLGWFTFKHLPVIVWYKIPYWPTIITGVDEWEKWMNFFLPDRTASLLPILSSSSWLSVSCNEDSLL